MRRNRLRSNLNRLFSFCSCTLVEKQFSEKKAEKEGHMTNVRAFAFTWHKFFIQ